MSHVSVISYAARTGLTSGECVDEFVEKLSDIQDKIAQLNGITNKELPEKCTVLRKFVSEKEDELKECYNRKLLNFKFNTQDEVKDEINKCDKYFQSHSSSVTQTKEKIKLERPTEVIRGENKPCKSKDETSEESEKKTETVEEPSGTDHLTGQELQVKSQAQASHVNSRNSDSVQVTQQKLLSNVNPSHTARETSGPIDDNSSRSSELVENQLQQLTNSDQSLLNKLDTPASTHTLQSGNPQKDQATRDETLHVQTPDSEDVNSQSTRAKEPVRGPDMGSYPIHAPNDTTSLGISVHVVTDASSASVANSENLHDITHISLPYNKATDAKEERAEASSDRTVVNRHIDNADTDGLSPDTKVTNSLDPGGINIADIVDGVAGLGDKVTRGVVANGEINCHLTSADKNICEKTLSQTAGSEPHLGEELDRERRNLEACDTQKHNDASHYPQCINIQGFPRTSNGI
ncbi:unnamed protein product [Plasmodium vivax]|uniref:(malaria parasite P. vivax) hypothetical protein n=1 Tax=Plasmodium vivax TaxID=5855 RepID=A0A8S4HG66_PLAVI|nr:unnamed protein product [Plasmodium vivax]